MTLAEQPEPRFQIDTDQFRGPADLLLYLVRRHEVEVTEIALAGVTGQFFEHMDVLKEIDINIVGDFIEVGSLLVELKARAVLPRNEHEIDQPDHDPREDLVHRLLLYKQFKDAATLIEDRAAAWQNRYSRISEDTPPKRDNMLEQPIKEVELWDLVSAFGRVLRDNRPVPRENIIYDETPIQSYMQRIHSQLVHRQQVLFSELFLPGMHKSAMVGVFLAVLELSRYHNVRTEQSDLHSDILIVPSDGFRDSFEADDVDDYDG